MEIRPLTADWRSWLRLNRDRGCDLLELHRLAAAEGFDPEEIQRELSSAQPSMPPQRHCWNQPPLTHPLHQPRAWRLDTPLAQVYEIPALLSRRHCEAVIAAIDRGLVPSTVTVGPDDYRTSRTCHLSDVEPALASELDQRLAALMGVPVELGEPLQGQRYDPGQYFRAHTDWFEPGTREFEEHTTQGGQRTWTLMIYLNTVIHGGETVFEHLGRAFTPVAGTALAWNNLHPDGGPNSHTLHEAMPVEEGVKYVITKWFRERAGR